MVVRAEDGDAFCRALKDGVQAALLFGDLREGAGVRDGNGRLIGEALEQGAFVGAETALEVTENEDDPHCTIVRHHW